MFFIRPKVNSLSAPSREWYRVVVNTPSHQAAADFDGRHAAAAPPTQRRYGSSLQITFKSIMVEAHIVFLLL